MTDIARILRHHHITLNVGAAQEDYDFHTQVLGLKSVKKTALYDGDKPIYHLYYGNDLGEESTLITCFPFRQLGKKARKGSGQIKTLSLSVPVSSLGFWSQRLAAHGFQVSQLEKFGEPTLRFEHPCGIEYELVGIADDDRKPYTNGAIPEGFGIRGTHGITVSVRDSEEAEEFMEGGWSGKRGPTDGNYLRYEVGDGGSGTIIDILKEPDLSQGSWTYGEGVPHHCAFEVANEDVQRTVKFQLEGLGYTDVSERKDRGYFDSVYVRTPGGALFEATVSKPQGFLVDETYEQMGSALQIPPFFMNRKDELIKSLEALRY